MGPEDRNHPQLAYITQQTATEKPKLTVIRGPDHVSLELTTAHLWALQKDITEALWRIYGPTLSQRNRD